MESHYVLLQYSRKIGEMATQRMVCVKKGIVNCNADTERQQLPRKAATDLATAHDAERQGAPVKVITQAQVSQYAEYIVNHRPRITTLCPAEADALLPQPFHIYMIDAARGSANETAA